MVGKALKQVFIGTVLSGVLVGLMGCTSVMSRFEPEPPVKHRKVVRMTPQPKVVRYKKTTARKVIKPVQETLTQPPAIPSLNGGGGGGGASGGGGWAG